MPEFEESEGFKLRSGNKSPFKQLGSSPAKDLGHGGHLGLSKAEAAKRDHGGKMSNEDKARRVKNNTKNLAIESLKTIVSPIYPVVEKVLSKKKEKIIEKRKKDDKRKENIKTVLDKRQTEKEKEEIRKINEENKKKENKKKKKKKERKDKEYENLPKLEKITETLIPKNKTKKKEESMSKEEIDKMPKGA